MSDIHIISASAGSGKTYRLSHLLSDEIKTGAVRPEAVVATTFTVKAASELQERVRRTLVEERMTDMARRLSAARMGTIHSVCSRLVSDFAFEKGLFPNLGVLDENLADLEFRRSLSSVVKRRNPATFARLNNRLEGFEWAEDVKEVLQQARLNGFEARDVLECKERSIAQLKAFLGEPEDGPHDERLKDALNDFLNQVDVARDATKTTKTALDVASDAKRMLDRGRDLGWSYWARLADLKVARNSLDLARPVHAAAAAWDVHPRFHADVIQAVSLVYELAVEAMDHFQEYKREWGVIDYSDQEVLALDLLGRDYVVERLRGEIDLLLVDEFQDTSPIQLAILLKLAGIARKTVWVGDQKQAIYGFRGTDPALMDSCIDALFRDRAPETLSKSWRSRPELVRMTSDLFVKAFAGHGLAEDLVRLEAAREEEPPGLGPVLEHWILNTSNKPDDAKALAAGVREMLDDPSVKVVDRKTGKARRVRAGDVGILCRLNKTCQDAADELDALGVKAELPGKGLLQTPEARLLVAGLRLWVDGGDVLAMAEIARLIHYPDRPDDWLGRVLEHPGKDAFETLPEVEAVNNLSAEHPLAGAVEALDHVIAGVNLRELCLAWGEAGRRIGALENLRQYAVKYAETCLASGAGGTPAGLIAHYEFLAGEEEDKRSGLTGEDAVTVVTWHRAKGLEWPVTILFELEKQYKPSALGVKVVSDREGFDLDDPLGGRWVRYLPSVNVTKKKDTPFQQRLLDHPISGEAADRDARQDLRLLYVGWTRARDRLVLPYREKNFNKGIMAMLQEGGECLLSTPEGGRVDWAGRRYEVVVRRLEPAEAQKSAAEPGSDYVAPGPREHPPARISPSKIERTGGVLEVTRMGERIVLAGRPEMNVLGDVFHAFMAADEPDLDEDHRHRIARRLLQEWDLASVVDHKALVRAGDRLWRWVEENHPGAEVRKEWPIMRRTAEGSIVAGEADLVLETDDSFTVVDHKTFPGSVEDAKEKARGFAGQLFMYADTIQAATGKELKGCYIHFPVSGVMVQVGREG